MASFQETRNTETSSAEVNPIEVRYKFDISADRLDEDCFESLDYNFTSFLKKRGKLYLATKLRNISSTEPMLKYFGQKLADDLKQQDAENLPATSYSAQLEPLECEGYSFHPLKIVIESHDPKKKKKTKSLIYTAIFFSWQVSEAGNDDFDLPFLFCIGTQKVLSSVNNLFKEYFGCQIMPAALSQHEIRWLMILILHEMSEYSIRPIHVRYQMVESSDMKMDLTFSVGVLREIWTRIHDEDASEITYKEVCTLHNAFEEHIQETLHIDLSYFHLKRFSVTDVVTIDVSGKLFMATGSIIDLVYRFLSER